MKMYVLIPMGLYLVEGVWDAVSIEGKRLASLCGITMSLKRFFCELCSFSLFIAFLSDPRSPPEQSFDHEPH